MFSSNGITQSKFHGDPINRVVILFPQNCCTAFTRSDYEFIHQKFNSLRNFRSFTYNTPVDITEIREGNFPDVATLHKGDACLLIGNGRLLEKSSFNFAKECFEHDIPVFFIRTNALYCDPRTSDPIWKTTTLTVQTAIGTRFFVAPEKYFMEIPTINDLILLERSDDFYALLPGMVPM